jgi:uncharacterized protein YcbK (DUF882 family)
MKLTKHFDSSEFACQCGCGTGEIKIELVQMLEDVRIAYDKPMRINSGIRCLGHNRDIGSRDTSSHIKCLAADIGCDSMGERLNLMQCIMRVSEMDSGLMLFQRIGLHKKFIHVDIDYDKPKGIFLY